MNQNLSKNPTNSLVIQQHQIAMQQAAQQLAAEKLKSSPKNTSIQHSSLSKNIPKTRLTLAEQLAKDNPEQSVSPDESKSPDFLHCMVEKTQAARLTEGIFRRNSQEKTEKLKKYKDQKAQKELLNPDNNRHSMLDILNQKPKGGVLHPKDEKNKNFKPVDKTDLHKMIQGALPPPPPKVSKQVDKTDLHKMIQGALPPPPPKSDEKKSSREKNTTKMQTEVEAPELFIDERAEINDHTPLPPTPPQLNIKHEMDDKVDEKIVETMGEKMDEKVGEKMITDEILKSSEEKPDKKRKSKSSEKMEPNKVITPKFVDVGTDCQDLYPVHAIPEANAKGNKTRRSVSVKQIPNNVKRISCKPAVGETLLHKAARQGLIANVLFYLESLQMNINERDNAGFTAIHEAVAANHIQIAEILLEFDADPNAAAHDGTRPIHDATESGNIEMCRMLLSYGADCTLNKYSGASIYDLAPNFEIKLFLNAYLRSIGMYYDSMSKQFLHKAGQDYPREELECIIAALQDEPRDVFDGLSDFESGSDYEKDTGITEKDEKIDENLKITETRLKPNDSGIIVEVYDVLKNEQGSKVCPEIFQTKFEQVHSGRIPGQQRTMALD
jgi:hypothetical protein